MINNSRKESKNSEGEIQHQASGQGEPLDFQFWGS
jgi:hypothetical protein